MLYKLQYFIVCENLAVNFFVLLTSEHTTDLQAQVSWINFPLNVQLFVCVCDHVAHAPFMTMHLKLLTC